MTRARERNLDDLTVATIVQVVDGWSGRLTWKALIDAIQQRAGLTYTRQALYRHERIRLAYCLRKKAHTITVDQPSATPAPLELQVALERIARLEAENARLTAENNALLEQFARWAYNAHSRDLTIDFLNAPPPAVNRQQSKRLTVARRLTGNGKAK